ncbi:hypothetical protein [Nonomuraea dietziae]|uniref:hypothetical protein n=1 Tax=Nonomuraea dietziae TaxID=65515 RepID=UPI003CD0B47D
MTGDLADREALTKAAKGLDAIFGLTIPFGENGAAEEIAQGRALADAARARWTPTSCTPRSRGRRARPTSRSSTPPPSRSCTATSSSRAPRSPPFSRSTSWRTPSTWA